MLGVTAAQGSFGIFDLNQGVYTAMSYNEAWQLHPDGPSPFTIATIGYGWSMLGAFDIAVLQERYGAVAHATGNDVYTLKDVNAEGTFYECIWDTGGVDEIRYAGTRDHADRLECGDARLLPDGRRRALLRRRHLGRLHDRQQCRHRECHRR
jgi:hypothetical protein